MTFADVNTVIRKNVYVILVIAITASHTGLSVKSSPPANHGWKNG